MVSKFYRIYRPERLADVLQNMVIPKMHRTGLARWEEDAVFLAESIEDAARLAPDVLSEQLISNYWNSIKRLVNECCRLCPERYTKVLRMPTKFLAIAIKSEWLDAGLLQYRYIDTVRVGEWLYPEPIALPEMPEVITLDGLVKPYYEMIQIRE